jgi:hypothetical protein
MGAEVTMMRSGIVIPAKASIHLSTSASGTMDPGLRRGDGF